MPIRWTLQKHLRGEHATGYALAALAGIERQTVYKLLREPEVTRIDAATLAALCKALHCKPGALLEYVPD